MGKAIVLVFFVIAFVAFAIIKAVFFGVKEAYNAVFDPNSGDEKIRQVVALCVAGVLEVMEKNYDGNTESLPGVIITLTPMVQSLILEHGYQASREMSESIVRNSIIQGGYATEEEVGRIYG